MQFYVTASMIAHLTLEHKALVTLGLEDELSSVQHVHRMFHPGPGFKGPCVCTLNMHFTGSLLVDFLLIAHLLQVTGKPQVLSLHNYFISRNDMLCMRTF